MRQPLIALALLIIMALPLSGTYLSFHWRKSQIQTAMKHRIRVAPTEENSILLKIPKSMEADPNSGFKRKHKREFKLWGNMYDVLRFEDRGDETWYWCILDKEETSLYAKLENIEKKAWGSNPFKPGEQAQIRLLLPQFVTQESSILLRCPRYDLAIQFSINSDPSPSNLNLKPIHQPPEINIPQLS